MEIIKKDKYLRLRKSLDELQIYFTFDIANYNLIEALIDKINSLKGELYLASASTEKIKTEYEKNLIYVNSLVNENDRLILENNDLHKRMMGIKTANTRSIEAKELEISKLNTEKSELKLLNSSYLYKVMLLEKELDGIKLKLSNVLQKIFENNIGENSLRKMFEKETKKSLSLSNTTIKGGMDKSGVTGVKGIGGMSNEFDDGRLAVCRGSVHMNFTLIPSDEVIYERERGDFKEGKEVNKMVEDIKSTFSKKKGDEVRSVKISDTYENDFELLKNQNLKLQEELSEAYAKINSQLGFVKLDQTSSVNPNINNINSFNVNSNNLYNNNNNIIQQFEEQQDTPLMSLTNTSQPHRSDNNNNTYLQIKKVLFDDKKSELIISYLKKEKENTEFKHRLQIELLMKEKKELEDKLSKTIKDTQYSSQRVKKQVIEVKEPKKEHSLKEIQILKDTVVEQSDEIKGYKRIVKDYKDKYILKEEVILNEKKFKELEDDLRNCRQLINVFEQKLKDQTAEKNSEKIIFNNNTVDLKIELEVAKKNNDLLNEKLRQIEEKYNEICDKYNQQVSVNMRLEGMLSKD